MIEELMSAYSPYGSETNTAPTCPPSNLGGLFLCRHCPWHLHQVTCWSEKTPSAWPPSLLKPLATEPDEGCIGASRWFHDPVAPFQLKIADIPSRRCLTRTLIGFSFSAGTRPSRSGAGAIVPIVLNWTPPTPQRLRHFTHRVRIGGA